MPHAPELSVPPKVGAIFVRDDPASGRHEAAVIERNIRHVGWSITIFDQSFLPLESSRFTQSVRKEDWRPIGWRYVAEASMFAPPEVDYDVKTDTWVAREVEESVPEMEQSSLPTRALIPLPDLEEHPMTWRARCRRMFPTLRSDEGKDLLTEIWNATKAQRG